MNIINSWFTRYIIYVILAATGINLIVALIHLHNYGGDFLSSFIHGGTYTYSICLGIYFFIAGLIFIFEEC